MKHDWLTEVEYNLTGNFERKRWKLSSQDMANSDTGLKNRWENHDDICKPN